MKIYTRTGDSGTTGLFGGGRVLKSHPRIEAYGTVDEANSAVGVARAFLPEPAAIQPLDQILAAIQRDLFVLGADLATPIESKAMTARLTSEHVDRIESSIDQLQDDLPPLKRFILPGGTHAGAHLHLARTICRRAERLVVDASAEEEISEFAVIYLNRLSDLLFVAARWINMREGVGDEEWNPSS